MEAPNATIYIENKSGKEYELTEKNIHYIKNQVLLGRFRRQTDQYIPLNNHEAKVLSELVVDKPIVEVEVKEEVEITKPKIKKQNGKSN